MDTKNKKKLYIYILSIVSAIVLIAAALIIVFSVRSCSNNELNDTREVYITEVSTYVNLDDYNDEEKTLINQIIKDAEDQIKATKSSEEMSKIVSDAKLKIATLPTTEDHNKEDLENAKIDKLAEIGNISSSYKKADYREKEWNNISTAIKNAVDDVNSSTSIDGVKNYSLDSLKAILSSQKTDKELTKEELEASKTSKINEIESIADKYPSSNYYDEENSERTKIIAEAIKTINNFTNIDEVNNYSLDSYETKLKNLNTKEDYKAVTLDETQFSIDLLDKTYSGSVITPSVECSTYTQGVDYTVEYTDNVNVGTATLKIVPMGNTYKYGFSKTFNIVAKDLEPSDFTIDLTDETYSGSAITKEITTSLVLDTDYKVEYSNNVNVGEATVVITGIGNYKGSVTLNFNITKCTITSDLFTVDLSDETYTGSKITKEITTSLVLDTDYRVYYDNNKIVGTAEISIIGAGNYTGNIKLNFNITVRKLKEADFKLSDTSYVYDGNEKLPSIITKLEANDYYPIYSNNVNAGTANVFIKSHSSNTDDFVQLYFTITPRTITESDFSIDLKDETYKGSAITKEITSTLSLTSGSDYDIEYSNNTNVGVASLIITFKGNYNGEFRYNFNIVAKDISDTENVTFTAYGNSYTGSALEPSKIEATYNGINLTSGVDYKITSYSNNINPTSNATVSIQGLGNYTGTLDLTFAIYTTNVSDLDFTLRKTSFDYTGSEIKPTVVEPSGYTFDDYSYYSITYSNNINAGTASVTITGYGYYTYSKVLTFTINKIDLPDDFSLNDIEYTGSSITSSDVTITSLSGLKVNDDYTLSVSSNDGSVGSELTITITGTGSYNTSSTRTLTSTIKAKTLTLSMFERIETQNYTGSAITPTVVVNSSYSLTLDTDYTVAYANNIDEGTASVTIAGIGNYTGSVVLTFDIEKIKLTSSMFASLEDKTYKGSQWTDTYLSIKSVTSSSLTKGKDFTVTSLGENINVGKGTVTITGMGLYKGSVTLEFNIVAKTIQKNFFTFNSDCTSYVPTLDFLYTGSTINPTVYIRSGYHVTSDDYDLTYPEESITFGNYTITITAKGNFTGTTTLTYNIVGTYQTSYDSSTKSYKITGLNDESLTEIEIPSTWNDGKNGDASVTIIGSEAFKSTLITSVVIPASITKIESGSRAKGAFFNCTNLKEVSLSSGLTTIGAYAFNSCTSLTSIVVPATVTSIGGNSFYGCTSLKNATLVEGLTTIDAYAFYGCTSLTSIVVPVTVTSIGQKAFASCTSLKDVTLNEGLTTIDKQAFYESTALTSISIPASVTTINNGAFNGCSGLTSVTFKDGSKITSFDEDYIFARCSSLKTITLPENVTSISNYMFAGCTSLTNVVIPKTITIISNTAFVKVTDKQDSGILDNIVLNYQGTSSDLANVKADSNGTALSSELKSKIKTNN